MPSLGRALSAAAIRAGSRTVAAAGLDRIVQDVDELEMIGALGGSMACSRRGLTRGTIRAGLSKESTSHEGVVAAHGDDRWARFISNSRRGSKPRLSSLGTRAIALDEIARRFSRDMKGPKTISAGSSMLGSVSRPRDHPVDQADAVAAAAGRDQDERAAW